MAIDTINSSERNTDIEKKIREISAFLNLDVESSLKQLKNFISGNKKEDNQSLDLAQKLISKINETSEEKPKLTQDDSYFLNAFGKLSKIKKDKLTEQESKEIAEKVLEELQAGLSKGELNKGNELGKLLSDSLNIVNDLGTDISLKNLLQENLFTSENNRKYVTINRKVAKIFLSESSSSSNEEKINLLYRQLPISNVNNIDKIYNFILEKKLTEWNNENNQQISELFGKKDNNQDNNKNNNQDNNQDNTLSLEELKIVLGQFTVFPEQEENLDEKISDIKQIIKEKFSNTSGKKTFENITNMLFFEDSSNTVHQPNDILSRTLNIFKKNNDHNENNTETISKNKKFNKAILSLQQLSDYFLTLPESEREFINKIFYKKNEIRSIISDGTLPGVYNETRRKYFEDLSTNYNLAFTKIINNNEIKNNDKFLALSNLNEIIFKLTEKAHDKNMELPKILNSLENNLLANFSTSMEPKSFIRGFLEPEIILKDQSKLKSQPITDYFSLYTKNREINFSNKKILISNIINLIKQFDKSNLTKKSKGKIQGYLGLFSGEININEENLREIQIFLKNTIDILNTIQGRQELEELLEPYFVEYFNQLFNNNINLAKSEQINDKIYAIKSSIPILVKKNYFKKIDAKIEKVYENSISKIKAEFKSENPEHKIEENFKRIEQLGVINDFLNQLNYLKNPLKEILKDAAMEIMLEFFNNTSDLLYSVDKTSKILTLLMVKHQLRDEKNILLEDIEKIRDATKEYKTKIEKNFDTIETEYMYEVVLKYPVTSSITSHEQFMEDYYDNLIRENNELEIKKHYDETHEQLENLPEFSQDSLTSLLENLAKKEKNKERSNDRSFKLYAINLMTKFILENPNKFAFESYKKKTLESMNVDSNRNYVFYTAHKALVEEYPEHHERISKFIFKQNLNVNSKYTIDDIILETIKAYEAHLREQLNNPHDIENTIKECWDYFSIKSISQLQDDKLFYDFCSQHHDSIPNIQNKELAKLINGIFELSQQSKIKSYNKFLEENNLPFTYSNILKFEKSLTLANKFNLSDEQLKLDLSKVDENSFYHNDWGSFVYQKTIFNSLIEIGVIENVNTSESDVLNNILTAISSDSFEELLNIMESYSSLPEDSKPKIKILGIEQDDKDYDVDVKNERAKKLYENINQLVLIYKNIKLAPDISEADSLRMKQIEDFLSNQNEAEEYFSHEFYSIALKNNSSLSEENRRIITFNYISKLEELFASGKGIEILSSNLFYHLVVKEQLKSTNFKNPKLKEITKKIRENFSQFEKLLKKFNLDAKNTNLNYNDLSYLLRGNSVIEAFNISQEDIIEFSSTLDVEEESWGEIFFDKVCERALQKVNGKGIKIDTQSEKVNPNIETAIKNNFASRIIELLISNSETLQNNHIEIRALENLQFINNDDSDVHDFLIDLKKIMGYYKKINESEDFNNSKIKQNIVKEIKYFLNNKDFNEFQSESFKQLFEKAKHLSESPINRLRSLISRHHENMDKDNLKRDLDEFEKFNNFYVQNSEMKHQAVHHSLLLNKLSKRYKNSGRTNKFFNKHDQIFYLNGKNKPFKPLKEVLSTLLSRAINKKGASNSTVEYLKDRINESSFIANEDHFNNQIRINKCLSNILDAKNKDDFETQFKENHGLLELIDQKEFIKIIKNFYKHKNLNGKSDGGYKAQMRIFGLGNKDNLKDVLHELLDRSVFKNKDRGASFGTLESLRRHLENDLFLVPSKDNIKLDHSIRNDPSDSSQIENDSFAKTEAAENMTEPGTPKEIEEPDDNTEQITPREHSTLLFSKGSTQFSSDHLKSKNNNDSIEEKLNKQEKSKVKP